MDVLVSLELRLRRVIREWKEGEGERVGCLSLSSGLLCLD